MAILVTLLFPCDRGRRLPQLDYSNNLVQKLDCRISTSRAKAGAAWAPQCSYLGALTITHDIEFSSSPDDETVRSTAGSDDLPIASQDKCNSWACIFG